MASRTKKCKICGKEYKYCKSEVPSGTYRWNDVACCKEHGEEYLRRVMSARTEDNEVQASQEDVIQSSAENTSEKANSKPKRSRKKRF